MPQELVAGWIAMLMESGFTTFCGQILPYYFFAERGKALLFFLFLPTSSQSSLWLECVWGWSTYPCMVPPSLILFLLVPIDTSNQGAWIFCSPPSLSSCLSSPASLRNALFSFFLPNSSILPVSFSLFSLFQNSLSPLSPCPVWFSGGCRS